MRRLLFACAVSAALLTVPGAAAAASSSTPAVRLTGCDPAARTADLEGDMRTMPGATRLQMRFSVEVRVGDEWRRVPAPTLDTWVSAQPGRSRYVYRKHVAGLQPGAAYRGLVRFRWRAGDGEVLRTTSRRSHTCAIPDLRPNLVPRGVEVQPGASADRALYLVTVANRGKGAAPATSVAFDAGDVVLPDQPAPALAAGESALVVFEGPVCAPGSPLVAGVDATGLVDEAVEADDVLTVPCPGS